MTTARVAPKKSKSWATEALSEVAGKVYCERGTSIMFSSRTSSRDNVICSVCKHILEPPVQLDCEHLACQQCLHEKLVADGQEADRQI